MRRIINISLLNLILFIVGLTLFLITKNQYLGGFIGSIIAIDFICKMEGFKTIKF
jgi:hypothetical protein